MRKYTLTLVFTIFCNLAFSQYVAFFKFKTDDPSTVVATMTDFMNSDYGKTIPAKVNLFAALFNAEDPTTHAVTFDFANENGATYGVFVIIFSIVSGFIAAALFRRSK